MHVDAIAASQNLPSAPSDADPPITIRAGFGGRLVAELVRFLSVGAVTTIVTVGMFNLLVHWGPSPMSSAPVTAYAIAFATGMAVAFAGNRYWAFAHRQSRHQAREFVAFAVINAVAVGIPALSLTLSRDALGLRSFWADNIAANGFGLVLATAFRFWAYRRWVFVGRPDDH